MTRNEPDPDELDDDLDEHDSGDDLYDSEDYAYDDTPSMSIFFSRNPRCSLKNPGERIQWEICITPAYVECLMIRAPPIVFL